MPLTHPYLSDMLSSGKDPGLSKREREIMARFDAGLISKSTAMAEILGYDTEQEPPPMATVIRPAKRRTVSPTSTSGPPNAYTNVKDGLRYYPWQGQQLMSVTSLRQQVGTPIGLVKWMQRQVAERALDGFIDLTNLIKSGEDSERIINWLVAGATDKRDRAGALGSAIHAHVATHADPTDADVLIRPFVENYHAAMNNLLIEPLLVERQVFSPSQGYAGSFDMIGMKDGEVTLIDLKTGGSLYIDNAIQLAGYVLADFIGQDDVIDEEATALLHSVTRLGLLHVTDTMFDYVDVPLTPVLGDAFRAQLTLAQFYAKHPNLGDLTGKELA